MKVHFLFGSSLTRRLRLQPTFQSLVAISATREIPPTVGSSWTHEHITTTVSNLNTNLPIILSRYSIHSPQSQIEQIKRSSAFPTLQRRDLKLPKYPLSPTTYPIQDAVGAPASAVPTATHSHFPLRLFLPGSETPESITEMRSIHHFSYSSASAAGAIMRPMATRRTYLYMRSIAPNRRLNVEDTSVCYAAGSLRDVHGWEGIGYKGSTPGREAAGRCCCCVGRCVPVRLPWRKPSPGVYL